MSATALFLYAVPLSFAYESLSTGTGGLILFGAVQATMLLFALAAISGALASGVGYAIWYAALEGLTASLAATVQLSVPILAALGGVLSMGESVHVRLIVSSLLILGGVGLALQAPERTASGHRP